MIIDFDKVILVLQEDFSVFNKTQSTIYLESQSSRKHYIDYSSMHKALHLYLDDSNYLTIAMWEANNRMIIIQGNDDDMFTEEQTNIHIASKIYRTEEEHFQDNLLKDLKAPFVFYELVLGLLDNE